jgi:hypothetical protein
VRRLHDAWQRHVERGSSSARRLPPSSGGIRASVSAPMREAASWVP